MENQLHIDAESMAYPQTELRTPETVMRLDRMGSFFPTRLSFLRSLLRDLASQNAKPNCAQRELDGHGYGHCVYEISLDGKFYSLIAYSSPLDPENRTDRVIAEAWDACFVLFDGKPSKADIEHLRDNATRQEAGRYNPVVLVLSRANKSVRLFEHVVDALAKGQQPDDKMVAATGYLMRTTAVYGNGKFGMADRADFADRPSLSQPFRLEMLTVFLIREFTIDLVNHVACSRGGKDAVTLNAATCRQLGIGNSTGLGMAPFLVSHPILINNWMLVRETALARVRAVKTLNDGQETQFENLCRRVKGHLQTWNVDDAPEQMRIEHLRAEFNTFAPRALELLSADTPWDKIVTESQRFSIDLQELIVAVVLEPNGDLIDGLTDCMEATSEPKLDPTMTVGTLREIIEEQYAWALSLDLSDERANAMAWYVSEDKLEPRVGARCGVEKHCQKMPHEIPHDIQALAAALDGRSEKESVAEFLAKSLQFRSIVRRVQTIAKHPYGEIRGNLVADDMRPIDLLRCKLSFFGASRFDPRSDRWTRITLYQGAPMAADLSRENASDCFLPSLEAPLG